MLFNDATALAERSLIIVVFACTLRPDVPGFADATGRFPARVAING